MYAMKNQILTSHVTIPHIFVVISTNYVVDATIPIHTGLWVSKLMPTQYGFRGLNNGLQELQGQPFFFC